MQIGAGEERDAEALLGQGMVEGDQGDQDEEENLYDLTRPDASLAEETDLWKFHWGVLLICILHQV